MSDTETRVSIEQAARESIVPPQAMWAMVGAPENFVEQGQAFSKYLIDHGRLTSRSSVLGVGCGLGKYAIHLAPFLAFGRYEGFDVEWPSVQWCQLAITPRYPHARFIHTPLRSEMYSPGATAAAADFTFPYGAGEFDFCFLASVFTHMFTEDVDNFVREICRVLKVGGRCLATMYLLNGEKRAGIAAGTSAFTFSIERDGCWLQTLTPPEAAVAYEETAVLAMFERAGLYPAEPIRFGSWAESGLHDQDFMLVEKR